MRSHSAASANTLGSGTPLQVGAIRGEKVHGGFSAQTAGNDSFIEIGIRQKADHPSASSREHLLPRSLKLFLQLGRRRVCLRELVLYAFALRNVLLDFFLIA
jgi:hypothetical protein